MSGTNYPEPRSDGDNAPLLHAWRERGELLLQHCTDCGAVVYYPRPLCPRCWSDRLEWRAVRGQGRILAFSLIHRPNQPAFFEEIPIVLAEIELAAGPLMLARVIADRAGAVQTGAQVALVDRDEARRFPLPTFRLKSA